MVALPFFSGPTFDPDKDIPDLTGQVYIVTGASSGIGAGIVAHLLQHNAAKIITLSSREDNALKAIENLKQWGDPSRVIWRKCNLKSLKDTDLLAKTLRSEEKRIDGLILNAGIGVAKYAESEDGIDNHFQINVLSQLHLALMLLRNLQATSAISGTPSRLVMMSSEMHRFAPWSTKFESLDEINTNLGATFLYSRSKLAQILLIRELARRIEDGQLGFLRPEEAASERRAILVNATHPGGVRTPQQEQLVPAYGFIGWIVLTLTRPLLVDPVTTGCRSALFAGTPNEGLLAGTGVSGQYIVPDKQVSRPSGTAQDGEMSKRVWTLSLALLQQKLGNLDYEFELVV